TEPPQGRWAAVERASLRAYLRYSPIRAGKERVWTRVVEPRFAWQRHAFVARTRFGARMAGDTEDILQQYLYFFGEWEPNLTAWLARTLRPGDVFVDVGANIGYFSVLAAGLVGPAGAVVAVEPSPTAFGMLVANLARNDAANARAVNLAAADRHAAVDVYRGPPSALGHTST